MRTFDELEKLWGESPPPPRQRGQVMLIVLRKGGGVHDTPAAVELSPEGGVHGDRWALGESPKAYYQVTLMNARVAELVADGQRPFSKSGDNFIVDLDLSEAALPAQTRLRLGTAVLEVQPEPHMGCKLFSERFGPEALRWVNWREFRPRRLRGVNCRILEAGRVTVGDGIARV
jgi:MOSC domain-containing protein YiiM